MTEHALFDSDERRLQVFALDDSSAFGERVCQALGVPLDAHEERLFDDGEHKCRPLVNVRGNDVFVVESLYGDPLHSANDKLCRLLFFIGAIKDAGAARVTAVLPYLAYSRKDRKTRTRDPVTTRYVAAMVEAVGTDAVMTLDVHNLAAFQNAFRIQSEHVEALPLFAAYLSPLIRERPVAVVAPDAGAISRASKLRDALANAIGDDVELAMAEKHRKGGELTGDMLAGDVAGKDAIIIDDMIATGATLVRTASVCRERGAARVFALATHGLFTGDAQQVLGACGFDRLVITDTVPPFRLDHGAFRNELIILASTSLIAEAIRQAHGGDSNDPVKNVVS